MCRHFGAVSLQGGPTTHQKWGAKEPHKIAAPPIHYHYHYHQRQNLLPAIQVHSLPPPYVLSGSKPVPSHAHSLHTRNIKCQRTAPTFIRLITIIRDSSNNTRGDEPSVEDTASRVGFPFVDTSKTIICRVCFYKGDDWCNFQFLRVKGRPQLMMLPAIKRSLTSNSQIHSKIIQTKCKYTVIKNTPSLCSQRSYWRLDVLVFVLIKDFTSNASSIFWRLIPKLLTPPPAIDSTAAH